MTRFSNSPSSLEYELDSKGVYRPLLRLDFGPGSLLLDLPAER